MSVLLNCPGCGVPEGVLHAPGCLQKVVDDYRRGVRRRRRPLDLVLGGW